MLRAPQEKYVPCASFPAGRTCASFPAGRTCASFPAGRTCASFPAGRKRKNCQKTPASKKALPN